MLKPELEKQILGCYCLLIKTTLKPCVCVSRVCVSCVCVRKREKKVCEREIYTKAGRKKRVEEQGKEKR